MNTTQAGAEAPKVRHFYEKCLIRKTPDEVPHMSDLPRSHKPGQSATLSVNRAHTTPDEVPHVNMNCANATPDEVPHFPDVRHFVRFTLMCARARVTHAHMGCQPAEVPHPPHQTNQ